MHLDSKLNISSLRIDTGTISVVPFSEALLHLTNISEYVATRSDLRVFEYAHDGPVTCMLVHESHQHQYLLSGGKDGAVKIWNLEQVFFCFSTLFFVSMLY